MSCKDKDYYTCSDCVNAWDLSMMYSCYESPKPVTDLEAEVSIGDCIEVNQGSERFWICVTDVCVCFVIGIVLGPLYFDHPFLAGDKIRVEIYHIYNVDKGCAEWSGN